MTPAGRHATASTPGDFAVTPVRPLLHAVHLLTFVVLLATGLLLFVPELRALATGGYSLLIRRVHLWTGVASIAVPLALLLRFGIRSFQPPPAKPSLRRLFQGANFVLTVAMTVLFAVTGLVLWPKELPYESLVDASRSAHGWLTYAAAAVVTIHLVDVGIRASITRMTTTSNRLGEETLP